MLLRAVDGAVRPRRGGRRLENVLLLPGRPERGNSAPRMQFVSTRPQPQQLGIQGLGLDSGSWSWAQALPPEEVCHQEPALRGEMAEGMPPMQVGAPPPAPWPPACRGGGARGRGGGGPRAAGGGGVGGTGARAAGRARRPRRPPPAPGAAGRRGRVPARPGAGAPGRPPRGQGFAGGGPGTRGPRRDRVPDPGPGPPRGWPAASRQAGDLDARGPWSDFTAAANSDRKVCLNVVRPSSLPKGNSDSRFSLAPAVIEEGAGGRCFLPSCQRWANLAALLEAPEHLSRLLTPKPPPDR